MHESTTQDAELRRRAHLRRQQSAIDVAASLVLAMLLWPFPLARMTLSVPVHVLSVLVFWQLVQTGYFAVTVSTWGQTAGMRLAGISLSENGGGEPTRSQRASWGAISGMLAFAVLVAPESGVSDSAETAARVEVRFPAPAGS
jgi:uncharacterized RDD family membrane protein YckC